MSTSLLSATKAQVGLARAPGALPSLTGLRWWSALLVFGLHARNFGYLSADGSVVWRALNTAVAGGSCGVSVFFVLSGFVLAWAARPNDRARDLWWRRAARIYPLHLVTALLAAVLAGTFVASLNSRDLGGNVANLLLVSSWNHEWWQVLDPASWSLVCEAFFYALFPLLMIVLTRCGAPVLLGVAVGAVACTWGLGIMGAALGFSAGLYSLPAARLPEFVAGMAVALLVRRGAWRGPGVPAALALWLVAYAAACGTRDAFLPSAVTLAPTVLLVAALAKADLTGRVSPLRGRLVNRLGELSYAFYLAQLLVIHAFGALAAALMPGVPLRGLLVVVVVFGLTLGCAWILNVAVERPARRWLLRLPPALARWRAGRIVSARSLGLLRR